MLFTNARMFLGERGFVPGSFRVRDGRFLEIAAEEKGGSRERETLPEVLERGEAERSLPASAEEVCADLRGLRVLPGLVDVHIHGCAGHDFSDGELSGLEAMGRYLARRGVTAFAPTSMSLPAARLEAAFRTADAYRRNRPSDGARVVGIHMEGPFFSEKRKGAQNGAFLRPPNAAEVLSLHDKCGRLLRFVDVAPELPGALEFIRELSGVCGISVAHTDASYEEALRAFDAGASHVTHLFNGMAELLHRSPGVVGAAFDRENVVAELIGDGLHSHPAIVRMAFRLFPGRICLVSDALRCTGMPDGEYELGGQRITLSDGEARLHDGTLAGASTDLFEDLARVISFGVPENEAILAASKTPAIEAGVWNELGSLETGKLADFLVCDEAWRIRQVYVGGENIL